MRMPPIVSVQVLKAGCPLNVKCAPLADFLAKVVWVLKHLKSALQEYVTLNDAPYAR
jgi:hypothetical protein